MARFFLVFAVVLGLIALGAYIFKNGLLFSGSDFGTTTPSGTSATYVNATTDDIFVTNPAPAASVADAIPVAGFARGRWYFEAVFPIEVRSAQGQVIGTGQGRAQGDWTTDQFVPFTANISVDAHYSGAALLVLQKDNPSGDPVRDASLSIPVVIQ
jgi:hypothetical protein